MKKSNQELKEYCLNHVPEVLNNSKLFTNVFGMKYALNRLLINLNKVYTADSKRNRLRRI